MAITMAEGRSFLVALMVEFNDDYMIQARILRVLMAQFPGVDWPAELRSRARASARLAASGLSIDWWVDEVIRLSA